MSFLQPAPKPKSLLGYHRVLAPTAGVRVSPICLGAMNFGDAWKGFMGECNKETSFEILDFFYEMGGNFIDTANTYQSEESEQWIGEWMEKRGVRDEIVLATKYTSGYRTAHHGKELQSNFTGNSAKSLHVSLEASLKKLKTSYIDLFYVHWWDFSTGVEEIMNKLNAAVQAGKILYLGVSDTPAWVVVKANAYARQHGLTPFSVYQGKWSASTRDLERDVIPMCQDQGMGIAPWGTLGQGNLKTEQQFEDKKKTPEGRAGRPPTENDLKTSAVLEKIANKKNTQLTSVAFAYIMQKTPYVFPILGGRKIEHLKQNIEALGLELSREEIDEINEATGFDVGFPMNMIFMGEKYDVNLDTSNVALLKTSAHIDVPEKPKAIKPRQE